MKVLSTEEMRRAELAAVADGVSLDTLMENAGLAVAKAACGKHGVGGRRVLVLVGPGNNGGDGLVAARHLRDWGALVSVWLGAPRDATDKNLKLVQDRAIPCLAADAKDTESLLAETDLVIDAIFGTGLSGAVRGFYKDVIEHINSSSTPVLAVDIPSGLDCDTGQPLGPAVRAEATVTFVARKMGFEAPGAEAYTG